MRIVTEKLTAETWGMQSKGGRAFRGRYPRGRAAIPCEGSGWNPAECRLVAIPSREAEVRPIVPCTAGFGPLRRPVGNRSNQTWEKKHGNKDSSENQGVHGCALLFVFRLNSPVR